MVGSLVGWVGGCPALRHSGRATAARFATGPRARTSAARVFQRATLLDDAAARNAAAPQRGEAVGTNHGSWRAGTRGARGGRGRRLPGAVACCSHAPERVARKPTARHRVRHRAAAGMRLGSVDPRRATMEKVGAASSRRAVIQLKIGEGVGSALARPIFSWVGAASSRRAVAGRAHARVLHLNLLAAVYTRVLHLAERSPVGGGGTSRGTRTR